jgi:superfamily I DNA/RNA helicase
MTTLSERVVERVGAEEEEDDIGELEIAEYIVFLLALDTYSRYIEDETGEDHADDLVRRGIQLVRLADRQHLAAVQMFLGEAVPTSGQKKMVDKAFRFLPNTAGLARRTFNIRTVLSRGGASTMRAIFKQNKALRAVKAAIEASMMDDADAALDKFAVIPLRNQRLRKWIDVAAETAGSGTYQNAVAVSADEVETESLLATRVQQQGASVSSEERQEAGAAKDEAIATVQEKATEAAQRSMAVSGEADESPTKSEVAGMAAAAVAAAMSDPDNPNNVPTPLQKLDDEQRAAALTDGRVLVAAGAGSGKSTTVVSRVEYLIKDRRVNPSRVLVTSFNTKAAGELKQKIGTATSGDTLNQMSVGTMHSLFRKFIGEYGTAQERSAMGLGKDRGGFVQGGGSVARAVQRIWADCYPAETPQERKVPKLKNVLMAKSKWAGNNVSPEEAKAQAKDQDERDAADWYAMYEGLKGSIPGWKPACSSSKAYESFMARMRPNGGRLGDFDDMLGLFLAILKREPPVKKTLQGMFDHILVDECVHEGTEVLTKFGESKAISELEVGEEILSYCNGSATFKKVLAKKRSSKTAGVTAHTKSGYSLTMTLDHRLYATRFDPCDIGENELALYLMYRKDMGYRVGVSTVPYLLGRSTQASGVFKSHRAGTEKADCLWVLEVGEESEMLYKELEYSLQYQIPSRIFEAEPRKCDQALSDRIFAKYGQNGLKLLELYGLSREFPHWVSSSYTNRKVVSISAHRPGGYGNRSLGRRTTASVSWTAGENEPLIPDGCKVYLTHGGVRKTTGVSDVSYVMASKAARALAQALGAYVVEDILVNGQSCVLTNAGSLKVGMELPIHLSGIDNNENVVNFMRGKEIRRLADKYRIQVPVRGCVHYSIYEAIRQAHLSATGQDLGARDDSKFGLDPIVALEPIEGVVFYDITVEDTGNFFGNGVLSHNCQDLNQVQNDIIELISEHVTDGSDGKSVWMVGDDRQCVSTSTLVATPEGEIPAGDLREGQFVLAYRNGCVVPQKVQYVVASSWTHGLFVTTESGRTLTMSPNHKIWATPPELEDDQHLVYLMYKEGVGFRVGVTNRGRSDANPYGSRMIHERADRLWVLNVESDLESALLKEAEYSLEFGVPTLVFNGVGRGINQDRVDAVFAKFGSKGAAILESKGMSFDLPVWMACGTTTRGSTQRRLINLTAHGAKGSQVRLEWSGDDLDARLDEMGVVFQKRGARRRLRKWFTNYRDSLDFAQRLQGSLGVPVRERLSTSEGPAPLITASSLMVGMQVAVLEGGCLDLELITGIESVPGTFVDLDIDDASNFFGGGILSHNSIYGFRGARPDIFIARSQAEGWKTRVIRTNYRCQPEIVDLANRLIAYNEDQIPLEANPAPSKTRGVGSVRVETAIDEADAALNVIEEIKASLAADGEVTDNAILTRTNKEQHAYETACIIRGVPYARKGTSSFLGSPETKAFLSYVQLVTGSNFAKMQAALGEVINKPNRFFVGPDAGVSAVSEAFANFSRQTNSDLKSVNPVQALGDSRFVETLAAKLARSRSGFKYNKTVEKLYEIHDELSRMQANLSDPSYTTYALFDDILGMTGTVAVTNPRTARAEYVEQTFRDSLKADLRDSLDEDDTTEEEEDETEGLGNISFLFELAKKDPTDEGDLLDDPNTPSGFKSKMERYAAKARELRIDISKWDKQQAALPPEQRKPPPGVYIGTAHGTKGAQWKNCYVSMPKGKFPFTPPQKPGAPPPDPEVVKEEMESERRLGYVALTRAAMNLTVVCPSSVGGKAAGISPFVDEAGLKVGENVPKPGAPTADTGSGGSKTATSNDYEGVVPDDWDIPAYDRRQS